MLDLTAFTPDKHCLSYKRLPQIFAHPTVLTQGIFTFKPLEKNIQLIFWALVQERNLLMLNTCLGIVI